MDIYVKFVHLFSSTEIIISDNLDNTETVYNDQKSNSLSKWHSPELLEYRKINFIQGMKKTNFINKNIDKVCHIVIL